MIAKLISDKKYQWDEYTDACVYAYNTAVQESTCISPFEVMFGRKALLPIEIEVDKMEADEIFTKLDKCNQSDQDLQILTDNRMDILKNTRENILKAQEKQKKIYDRKHATPDSFQVGDNVLRKDFMRKKRSGGKLDAHFTGPYVIVKIGSKGQYHLHLLNDPTKTVVKASGCHLKPYNLQCETYFTSSQPKKV